MNSLSIADRPISFSRASHATFTVHDLARSREFYTEVVGLVVSYEDRDTLYLRGLEERAHHSLVLRRKEGAPECERVGMRVGDEEMLDKVHHHFAAQKLPCTWVDRPFQARTLHVADPLGTPLELVATMDRCERLDMKVQLHKGAAARRFDHYQVTVPDVRAGADFYRTLGFRVADAMMAGERMVGAFLHVKNTPYDMVFVERDGPAIHHFAYVVPDVQSMLRACDTLGEMGLPDAVEYGPGKHALGHSYYVYLLDPDGHRIELLLPPIVYMDADDVPAVWDVTKVNRATECWGLPPRDSWFLRRTAFSGHSLDAQTTDNPALSLEKYLQPIP